MKSVLVCLCLLFSTAAAAVTTEVINLQPEKGDMTPALRRAIEAAKSKNIRIVLQKGTYKFFPDYAYSAYRVITNHGNGLKKSAFVFDGFDAVEIEGNDAELIFHGQMAPFQFYNSNNIKVRDVSVDWDVPFTFTAEVTAVNPQQGWVELLPLPGQQARVAKGRLLFPDVDDFNYPYPGSSLYFDPVNKRVVHGAWDFSSFPSRVEKLPGGKIRLYEELKQYPQVGFWWTSKGDRDNDRYAPAFQVRNSNNILLDGVKVHHALGMAFLFERSRDISILNSAVVLKDEEHGNRVISSTADASHFANCGGDILIENSRFENMLDDGVNVHGTYVKVDAILDDHSVRAELMHFEQLGFEFAGEGDEVWFIHKPDVSRQQVDKVVGVKPVNEQYVELTFSQPLPESLKVGDLLENKTWNPTFTLRNSQIGDHRARSIVLKTPKKIVIENNRFYSMMSCVFLRGESHYWYESGAVTDVTIRNNRFEHCAYSGGEHAVLTITPRLGKGFDARQLFDSNIQFVDNDVITFDNRVVWADRVNNIKVAGNHIRHVTDASRPPLYPDAPVFEFSNSQNIQLYGNDYVGEAKELIRADDASKASLSTKAPANGSQPAD
ncbi:alpha-1,3-galactosidase-related protein [Shewanella sp. GXUN23E]|uniref:alpha-1,3-galactosidase-related protein n=1 Tax=Shewanella sp. GXUN23E TaxID=3422498 RepID=UPI003D7E1E76